MVNNISICWFRQDLRIADNPALSAAIARGKVLPVYILDDENAGAYQMGGASRWWLHNSLLSLNNSLNDCLCFYRGDAAKIIADLVDKFDVQEIFYNRCYEPWRIRRDIALKKKMEGLGVKVHSFNGSLLFEPWEISKSDGSPYKVFTPFYRNGYLGHSKFRETISAPDEMELFSDASSLSIDELSLLPKNKWYEKLAKHWQVGEAKAHERLADFIENGISGYKEGRNYPAKNNISRLSPHLHFGEISPVQIWHSARALGDDINIDHFCQELGWREFSYHLLYYFPDMPEKNLKPKFDNFPWADDYDKLQAWQRGMTGIPIVDAGMRELWQTGYMHNRVRMIVASFLIKNLMIDWRHGEEWFWDCLVDADLASNSASWQWVAGSGMDAAPYFRIFNPVTQAEKFDPDGAYILHYIPELKSLNKKYIFSPWNAPDKELENAGIILGRDYPLPITDIKKSREMALDAFKHL